MGTFFKVEETVWRSVRASAGILYFFPVFLYNNVC